MTTLDLFISLTWVWLLCSALSTLLILGVFYVGGRRGRP